MLWCIVHLDQEKRKGIPRKKKERKEKEKRGENKKQGEKKEEKINWGEKRTK